MHQPNFTPFPVLATERLTLRGLTSADENEIFAIRSDEKMAEFLDRPICKTLNEAREFIQMINKGIEQGESLYWAITFKDDTKLIGTICIWQISITESKAEIGFELLPAYQGKGIMQEAATIVIDYGFNTMQLDTIEGEVAPGNIKSIKLMEHKGFTRVPEIRENDSESVKNLTTVMYKLEKKRN